MHPHVIVWLWGSSNLCDRYLCCSFFLGSLQPLPGELTPADAAAAAAMQLVCCAGLVLRLVALAREHSPRKGCG
jgi:hypothetical protein